MNDSLKVTPLFKVEIGSLAPNDHLIYFHFFEGMGVEVKKQENDPEVPMDFYEVLLTQEQYNRFDSWAKKNQLV